MLAAALVAMAPARGAEWVIEPRLGARVEYNDNYTLSPVKQPTWLGSVTPEVSFSRNTEASSMGATLGLSILQFSNNTVAPDQVNPRVIWTSALQQDRNTYRFNASYITANTFTTALTGQGLVITNARNNALVFNPGWSRTLSERSTVAVDYSYQQTTYDTTVPTGLTDFQSQSLSATFQRQYSERLLLIGSLSASEFKTANDSTKSLTYSANAGGTYTWSERTKATFIVGSALTDTTNQGSQVICPGPIILCQLGFLAFQTITSQSNSQVRTLLLNGNFSTQLTENQTLGGQIGRNILPSAAGQVLVTDNLSFTYSYQPTARWLYSLNASISQANFAQAASTSTSSQIVVIEPRVLWNADPWMDLGLGFKYAASSYQAAGSADAQSLGIYATLTYRWQKFSVAR